jgi:hypothetical protein
LPLSLKENPIPSKKMVESSSNNCLGGLKQLAYCGVCETRS